MPRYLHEFCAVIPLYLLCSVLGAWLPLGDVIIMDLGQGKLRRNRINTLHNGISILLLLTTV